MVAGVFAGTIGVCIHVSMVDEVCVRGAPTMPCMTCPIDTLADPLALATQPDPYPGYARWRQGPPLRFDPRSRLWVASRADVVSALLAHPDLRVRPASESVPPALRGGCAGQVFARLVRMTDGTHHAQLKPALRRAIGGALLVRLPASARHAAREVSVAPLDAWLFTLPLYALAHALGVEDASCAEVAQDGHAFAACVSTMATPTQVLAAHHAARRLDDRFRAMVSHAPADSPLAELRDAAPTDVDAVIANLIGLFSQTCDGTAGLLGSSVRAWARECGLAALLRARPEVLPDFVAEVARHDAPIQNTRRFVAAPSTVHGVDLAAGDAVLLLLAAANRDPALNAAPDVFRLDRADRRTLGFGHGTHACPGQTAAFTIATTGLQALLDARIDLDALANDGGGFHASANARIPFFRTGAP